jgi:hypothetical protein
MYKILRPIALVTRWATAVADVDVALTAPSSEAPGAFSWSRPRTAKALSTALRVRRTLRHSRPVPPAHLQHTLERHAARVEAPPWLC